MPYFLKLDEQNLNYLDVLTYVALKSFDNPDHRCFPSYESIADRAGLSRDFIIKSISRLKDAGYIRIWRRAGFQSANKSYPNHYYFNKLDKGDYFFMIPYELLSEDRITNYEKAILLLLYQFSVTPTTVIGKMDRFVKMLGISKNAIYKKYLSLADKGFIDKSRFNKYGILNLLIIDWDFTYYLKGLEDQNCQELKVA
ncbi:helix-turn-helix domain-containing protein [Flavobacterium nitrogenifigens]